MNRCARWTPPERTRRAWLWVWGSVLTATTGLPLIVAFTEGFDPYDMDTSPAPAALTFATGGVGILTLVAAAFGCRLLGWLMVGAAPVLMVLSVFVNVERGAAWVGDWWRPVFFGLIAAVPAALVLTRRRQASKVE